MAWRQVLAWVLTVPAVIWAAIRLAGWDVRYPVTQVIAFTPYVAALALIPLVVAVLLRQWPAAVVAAVALVALVSCVLPRWLADSDPLAGARGPQLRVLTANVLAGRASAEEIVRLVTEQKAEVLLLQELTPDFVARAAAEGLDALMPYKAIYPMDGVIGSGIYSRQPLRAEGVRVNKGGFWQATAELAGSGVLLESAHPRAPFDSATTKLWRDDFPDEPRATPDGPLRILGGDFNATLDHSVLRDLISSGYRDAAATVGQGLVGTWGPYDGDNIPPVTLDRVLADRRIGVVEVRVFPVTDSDHRALLAVLQLP
ncbi:endonuclease [Rhizocola hellebori]|uniref:Endonuclease n=1 Tax=Rhizocola hellebori TaxID=1392758 RepID=A0A8J3VKS5_9ACTN|nr:endonuclease/exonuclease/phosphatase family protein [Rhizocola hellebori]GIH09356.1 endonuclease [Rhizocola hellebori]